MVVLNSKISPGCIGIGPPDGSSVGSTIVVCMVITYYSIVQDQPGKKVANPARGQLNKENVFSPVPVRA